MRYSAIAVTSLAKGLSVSLPLIDTPLFPPAGRARSLRQPCPFSGPSLSFHPPTHALHGCHHIQVARECHHIIQVVRQNWVRLLYTRVTRAVTAMIVRVVFLFSYCPFSPHAGVHKFGKKDSGRGGGARVLSLSRVQLATSRGKASFLTLFAR